MRLTNRQANVGYAEIYPNKLKLADFEIWFFYITTTAMSVEITNRKLTIDGKPIDSDVLHHYFNHETKFYHSLSPNGQFLFLYQRNHLNIQDQIILINLSTGKSESVEFFFEQDSSDQPIIAWSKDSSRFAYVHSATNPNDIEIQITNTSTFAKNTIYPPRDCWCNSIKLHDRFLEIDNRILIAEPIGWIIAELSHHIIPPLAKLVVDILNPQL